MTSIERLSANDALMLRADELWPQDIGAIAILDGSRMFDAERRFRLELIRDAIASRLHRAPRFRQVVHTPGRGLGGPLWVDAPRFDLTEHIRVHALPASSGETELLSATEELRRRRLDPSRPLWEMWFMPGLPDERVGVYVRMHHAIADGLAAIGMVGVFLDAGAAATAGPPHPWTPAPPPSARALAVDNAVRSVRGVVHGISVIAHPRRTFRGVLGSVPAIRELLAEPPSTKTSLDRLVGADRRIALIRSRLDVVRDIAHAHRATVNDVLLAATAAGLRALLRSRGEPVEDVEMRVAVPVSLRRGEADKAKGNLIGEMAVPLRLAVSEPDDRLRTIADETAKRKVRGRPSLGAVFRIGFVRRFLMKVLAGQRQNVLTTNIRGPQMPLHLAGSRVLEVFPLVNLFGNQSLGVGALSYAGAFNICVIADGTSYPDIEVFAAGLRDGLEALSPTMHATPAAERVPALA